MGAASPSLPFVSAGAGGGASSVLRAPPLRQAPRPGKRLRDTRRRMARTAPAPDVLLGRESARQRPGGGQIATSAAPGSRRQDEPARPGEREAGVAVDMLRRA